METLDLGLKRKGQLNEFILTMLGHHIKKILGGLFGGYSVPVNIKGTRQEISAFADALSKEKSHLEAFQKYGLDNPYTYRSKAELSQAINKFERFSGVTWPFH